MLRYLGLREIGGVDRRALHLLETFLNKRFLESLVNAENATTSEERLAELEKAEAILRGMAEKHFAVAELADLLCIFYKDHADVIEHSFEKRIKLQFQYLDIEKNPKVAHRYLTESRLHGFAGLTEKEVLALISCTIHSTSYLLSRYALSYLSEYYLQKAASNENVLTNYLLFLNECAHAGDKTSAYQLNSLLMMSNSSTSFSHPFLFRGCRITFNGHATVNDSNGNRYDISNAISCIKSDEFYLASISFQDGFTAFSMQPKARQLANRLFATETYLKFTLIKEHLISTMKNLTTVIFDCATQEQLALLAGHRDKDVAKLATFCINNHYSHRA
jgi:hypothetical protein